MANGGGEFPVGKLISFCVVLGLTVLPVASCGPIDFMGHEILRNKVPNTESLTEGLGSALGTPSQGTPKRAEKRDRDTLFPPSQSWMWILYIAVFGAGVLSIFIPSGNPGRAAVGAFGLAGLLLFLGRFQTAILEGETNTAGITMIKWAVGAYVALVAFAMMVLEGLNARRGGSRRVVD